MLEYPNPDIVLNVESWRAVVKDIEVVIINCGTLYFKKPTIVQTAISMAKI